MTVYTSLQEFATYAETEAFAPTKPKKRDITAEELRAILHYDPETGRFTWIVSNTNRVKVGARAGNPQPNGYRAIQIEGRCYKEHRLAWLYVYGVMPTHQLDHINGLKADNRIENLREATNAQNMANQGKRRANTSGHKGVHWHKVTGKWQAQISVNYKSIHIGLFTNIDDASAAYQAAALKFQGEFARQDNSLQPAAEVNPKD